MKKFFIFLIIFFCSAQFARCELNQGGINLYNLQKNNDYILNLGFKAEKIDLSDNKSIKIMPVTSIYEDKNQLFIEAVENGVCDVKITSNKADYKVRFVTGPVFWENGDNIFLVDTPFDIKKD